ncbi:response regulator [Pelagicoccus sp. SDUM812005]|uniref:response regulator n=1 Tax=Pelagicoccus sp. SDUM812005 TaxID=3041257 RepID=UPI00280C629A|nr:response regulator [Pelagicoccus sp. SDUM812005]MDQ8180958.1 response regulator [Pelagicoccus sp. SDUM812005]
MASPTKKILLIDDEPSILITFKIALGRLGYELTTEQVASAGLKLAKEGNFDLVIVDYRMPGLHGVEVIAQIRQAGCEMPIMLMSASDSPLNTLPAQLRRNTSFESKPLSPETLKEAVKSLLEQTGD